MNDTALQSSPITLDRRLVLGDTDYQVTAFPTDDHRIDLCIVSTDPQGHVISELSAGLTRADAVRLIPAEGWWMAMCLAEPDIRDMYCDVTTPAVWTGPAEITVVDLDIDLVRYRADGRVEVEDEDEFAEHRVSLGYPDEIVEGALRAVTELREALSHGEEPFTDHCRKWLAQVGQP